MTGDFAFPYRHAFFQRFKERIFLSCFSQFVTCFRSMWKLLAVWLMFLPFSVGNFQFEFFKEWSSSSWCHFELTHTQNNKEHQIKFLYAKQRTFKFQQKNLLNGSLEHSKGSDEHSKDKLRNSKLRKDIEKQRNDVNTRLKNFANRKTYPL